MCHRDDIDLLLSMTSYHVFGSVLIKCQIGNPLKIVFRSLDFRIFFQNVRYEHITDKQLNNVWILSVDLFENTENCIMLFLLFNSRNILSTVKYFYTLVDISIQFVFKLRAQKFFTRYNETLLMKYVCHFPDTMKYQLIWN